MHLELPLERRRGRAAQLSFATEAMDRLPQRTDYALTPSPLGLHLLGRDEDALEAPIEALPRYEARVRKAMARRGAKAGHGPALDGLEPLHPRKARKETN